MYVVGGVVDKVCNKVRHVQQVLFDLLLLLCPLLLASGVFFLSQRLTEYAAESMKIQTARLPIREHLQPQGMTGACSKLDLPLDQVIMMMISVHSHGDWSKALQQYFPKRKQWTPLPL